MPDSTSAERTMQNECYSCVRHRKVPGDAHIACMKPDPEMTGSPHGVKNGWFLYPFLFDPVWKEKICCNFVPIIFGDATKEEK
jgi:hypothetical protein